MIYMIVSRSTFNNAKLAKQPWKKEEKCTRKMRKRRGKKEEKGGKEGEKGE